MVQGGTEEVNKRRVETASILSYPLGNHLESCS